MDSLPAEILQLICKYTGDICGASLRRLALVNHAFYYAALPHIYSCVTIKFFNYSTLDRAVNEIIATPRAKHYRAYARRLDVLTLPETWGQIAASDTRLDPSHTPQLEQFVEIDEFIPDIVNMNLTAKVLSQWRTPSLDDMAPEPSYYKEKDWRPLVMLLPTLNRLRTFNYAVKNNFPSCLLEAIHQHHLTCQLNIWDYENIALDIPGMGNVIASKFPKFEEDLFEMKLLRSPCLKAIKVYYLHEWDRNLRISTEQDAIIPLFTMASSLDFLQIKSANGRGITESNEKWNEYMTSLGPLPTARPCPTTLSLGRGSSGRLHLFEKWSQCFDFSSIQALDIGDIRDISETASLLAGLWKLERLFIDLGQLYKPVLGTHRFHEVDYTSLFDSINPLKCLRVRGLRDKAGIFAILAYHGKTLQKLFIEPGQSGYRTERYYTYPVLDHVDILKLAKEAPTLRQLRLTLDRSGGDSHERMLYEALGSFPSLHILILDLHYRHEGEDQSVTSLAQLKEAFINAAMDESLAMQIWDLIYSKQTKEKLQKLRLVPFGWNLFSSRAEREILLHLSRSVLISKRGRDCGLESIQIGREEICLQNLREEIATGDPNLTHFPPQRLRRLIKSLWKLSNSNLEDWTRHWRSFPLNTNGGGTT